MASYYGFPEVLQWWMESGLEIKFDKEAVTRNKRDDVEGLQWDSGLPLMYDEEAVRRASYHGHINVLQWWKDSGLEFKAAIDGASERGKAEVLQWWKDSGYELKFTQKAVLGAVQGH
ncbi:hypothetical protein DFJ73DRAFT_762300 [Zopfochytrium polystomum]|nr:hypothetical protein DFJ73DRAFT_762300 [Zopfochytrium polystomum]